MAIVKVFLILAPHWASESIQRGLCKKCFALNCVVIVSHLRQVYFSSW